MNLEELLRNAGLQPERFHKPDNHATRGPCWCGGTRRLVVYLDSGYYRCDRCGRDGFLESGVKTQPVFVPSQPINDMSCNLEWTVYETHPDLDYWIGEGIPEPTVRKFHLGYCMDCPMYPGSPSHTIPVWEDDELVNIRHRIINPARPGDKYRPHRPGLGNHMFNTNILRTETNIVLLEGEKKTMVFDANGFAAVGIPGASSFKTAWIDKFDNAKVVYIALDPGMELQAQKIAELLGEKARICSFPVKPDEFIFRYGGARDGVVSVLKQGRRLRNDKGHRW